MNRYDHYTDKFITDPHDTQYGILGTNLAEVGTDMVSKQAVLDLWNKYHSYIATKAIEFDSELRALPPADPQIIMCQHCKEFDENHHYCTLHDIEMSLTDFCSYAERRTE